MVTELTIQETIKLIGEKWYQNLKNDIYETMKKSKRYKNPKKEIQVMLYVIMISDKHYLHTISTNQKIKDEKNNIYDKFIVKQIILTDESDFILDSYNAIKADASKVDGIIY
jgi:hypothetical protein